MPKTRFWRRGARRLSPITPPLALGGAGGVPSSPPLCRPSAPTRTDPDRPGPPPRPPRSRRYSLISITNSGRRGDGRRRARRLPAGRSFVAPRPVVTGRATRRRCRPTGAAPPVYLAPCRRRSSNRRRRRHHGAPAHYTGSRRQPAGAAIRARPLSTAELQARPHGAADESRTNR